MSILLSSFVIYFSLLQGCFGTHTTCDDGWMTFEGYCYLIGHYKLRFVEAEHFCQQHGGHVLEPLSSEENNFIKETFRYLTPNSYWFGFTDELVEGTWRGYNSKQVVNFTDWFPGQPGSDGPEDCSSSWKAYDFKWADVPCNYDLIPVCKRRGFNDETAEIVG